MPSSGPGRILLLVVLGWAAGVAANAADGPDIRFLDLERGRVAIVDDSDDPYFALLQQQEIGAKTDAAMPNGAMSWQRNACRSRFQDAVRTFTPEEQAAITRVITSIYPVLAQRFPLVAKVPWRFIKLERRFEGDTAHTRGHCIVLSAGVMRVFQRDPGYGFDESDAFLLLNEQLHIIERFNRPLFVPLFAQRWGFIHMEEPPALSGQLRDHQYLDPDSITRDWLYPVPVGSATMLIQPQIFLRSTSAVPKLPEDRDFVALGVEAHAGGYRYLVGAGGEIAMYELSTVTPYLAAFAPCTELISPNDIAAELFADLVIALSRATAPPSTPLMDGFSTWAQSPQGFGRPAPAP